MISLKNKLKIAFLKCLYKNWREICLKQYPFTLVVDKETNKLHQRRFIDLFQRKHSRSIPHKCLKNNNQKSLAQHLKNMCHESFVEESAI